MILFLAARKLLVRLLVFGLLMNACDQKEKNGDLLSEGEKRHRDYIRKIPGKDEHVPEEVLAKGEGSV